MYKVLIVDDEPLFIEYLCSLVDWNSLGFEIAASVCSGEQAKGIIDSGDISLVLTDVMMPGMGGVELSDWMRKEHPDIKMVALSGYDDYDYVREILLNGASDYVLKHRLSSELLSDILSKVWREIESDNDRTHMPIKMKAEFRREAAAGNRERMKEIMEENLAATTDRTMLLSEFIEVLRSFSDYLEYEEILEERAPELMDLAEEGSFSAFFDGYMDLLESISIIDPSLRAYGGYADRAISFIENNYSLNIKLDDCADVLGVTSAYLSRIFHQDLGLTFIEKLNRVRIRKAKEQIMEAKTLKEIAYSCGFKNYNYFFKVFKKLTGLTPLQYQDAHCSK